MKDVGKDSDRLYERGTLLKNNIYSFLVLEIRIIGREGSCKLAVQSAVCNYIQRKKISRDEETRISSLY